MTKMWIVYHGTLVDCVDGSGGFEFVGPFESEKAARKHRQKIMDIFLKNHEVGTFLCEAIELINPRS